MAPRTVAAAAAMTAIRRVPLAGLAPAALSVDFAELVVSSVICPMPGASSEGGTMIDSPPMFSSATCGVVAVEGGRVGDGLRTIEFVGVLKV